MARDNDIELIKRIRSSLESNAQEILIKKYMPMVRYIVKNQNIPPVDFEDYFQEGMIGLLKAIMNFDLEQHANKFSTFAYVCILRRIFNIKKQVYRKRSLSSCSCFLQTTFLSDDSSNPLALIPDYHMEPFLQVEEKFIRQELDFILKAYLSPVEYYVVWLMISDYQLRKSGKY